jgi:RimJ/RimL family protein N-acetyltransferase
MCRTFNKASARVLEKAGYKYEGTIHKNKFLNGKYVDDMIWAKWK